MPGLTGNELLVGTIVFAFGGFASWLAWLSLEWVVKGRPMYERFFGSDADDTADGHLVESHDRFDQLDSAHGELAAEVDDIHDDLRKVENRQEVVLSNQKAIAEGIGVDLERPRFYRAGRASGDRNPPGDD